MNPMTPLRFVALTPDEVLDAIADAFGAVEGGAPSGKTLEILGAHSAHETGRWKRCPNYNLAGIRGAAPDGGWTSFATHEVVKGVSTLVPPGPSNRFRAYASLRDAAEDYLRVLKTRFPVGYAAALAGDDVAFVHGLRAQGYFTADPALYLRAEQSQEQWLESFDIMRAWLAKGGPPDVA